MLTLLAGLALAQDTAPRGWELRYERGMRRARAGAIVSVTGEVALLSGTALAFTGALGWDGPNNSPMMISGLVLAAAGGVAAATGPALMASGSLGARDSLRDGGREVSAAPAYLAWGLWAGSMGLGLANIVEFSDGTVSTDYVLTFTALNYAFRIGANSLGSAQMVVNQRARDASAVRLYVTPLAVRGGAGTAVGSWF